jgi:hypothetical protein
LVKSRNYKPTNWYDTQYPFELEFIVNTPLGMHKILDNLLIISNNAEPESIEFELVGDVYDFDKESIYNSVNKVDSFAKVYVEDVLGKKRGYTTKVVKSNLYNEYNIVTHQDVFNIEKYGRRLGNIQYNEDK